EQDAVKTAAGDRFAYRLGDVRVGDILDGTARRCPGGNRQNDLGPFPCGEIEISPESRPSTAISADRSLAIERAKPLERRRHRRKGVGLVLHHRDQEAHAGPPWLQRLCPFWTHIAIDRALHGEEVIITRHGKPVADARPGVGLTSVEILDLLYETDDH